MLSVTSSRRTSEANLGHLPPEADKHSRERQIFGAYVLATVMSALACVLVGVSCALRYGYRWHSGGSRDETEANEMFSFHPLFMTIAMIFIQSQAALMYRTLRYRKFSKFVIKLFHGGIQLGTFVLLIFGLQAAFTALRAKELWHLEDAHAWLGLILVIFFCMQLFLGFGIFLFPGAKPEIRAWYALSHRCYGVVSILTSCVVVCMGMAMYQRQGFSSVAILDNVFCIAVVVYGVAMGFIFARDDFKGPFPEGNTDHDKK